jgi:hypothetical protein
MNKYNFSIGCFGTVDAATLINVHQGIGLDSLLTYWQVCKVCKTFSNSICDVKSISLTTKSSILRAALLKKAKNQQS